MFEPLLLQALRLEPCILGAFLVDALLLEPCLLRALTFELATAPRLQAGGGGTFQEEKRDAIDRFELEYLGDLMAEHADNVKQASRASGIERTQLKRLLPRVARNCRGLD